MDRPFGRVGGGGGYSEPAKGKSAADVLLGLGGAPAQKHVAFTADTKPSQAAALLGGAGVGLGGGPGLVKSGDKSAGQIGLAKSGSTAADFLLGTGGAATAPPTAPPATPTKPAGGLVKSGSTAADFLLGSNATGDAVVASPHPAQGRAAAYFGAGAAPGAVRFGGAAAPGDAKGDGFLDFKAAPALFADSYYEGEEKKYIKTRDPLYLERELEPKALFNAAAAGDGGAVNKLLLLGAAPSWRNVAGRTALHAAVWNHDKPVVAAALLDAGAPVDERTLGGFQWLLQEQEARDVGEGGATPLMLAAARGHVRTLAMLLERGASTAAVDAGGRTAADVARSHDQKDALELLLAAASDAFGPEALFNAAVGGDAPTVRKLLGKGASASWRAETGATALHAASWNHDRPTVGMMLLDAGVHIDARMYAPRSTLKKGGGGPGTSQSEGTVYVFGSAAGGAARLEPRAPLEAVACGGRVTSGAAWSSSAPARVQGYARTDPAAVTDATFGEHGETALMLAAAAGHYGTVEMLLGRGASATLTNGRGSTAADLARRHGHFEVAHLLEGRRSRTLTFVSVAHDEGPAPPPSARAKSTGVSALLEAAGIVDPDRIDAAVGWCESLGFEHVREIKELAADEDEEAALVAELCAQLQPLRFADEKRLRHLLSAAPQWKPYANANGGRRGGGGGKPAAAAPTDAVAAAFYYHDDNYSGFLDYRELRNALQTMGINVHMGTSIEILRRYDDTPDGKLDLAEFRQLCSDLNGENGAGNAAPPKPPRPYSGAGYVASMGAAAEYVPTDASGIVVMYGDNLHVVSCFAAGKTYLDANGHSKQPEAMYDVGTHHSARRAGEQQTGVWSLESAAGIAGAVQYGDELLIRSCFTAAESFLDVNGESAQAGAAADVCTHGAPHRGNGTTTAWKIESPSGRSGPVRCAQTIRPGAILPHFSEPPRTPSPRRYGDEFWIRSCAASEATFLDVNGRARGDGAKYDVVTHPTSTRLLEGVNHRTTVWTVEPAPGTAVAAAGGAQCAAAVTAARTTDTLRAHAGHTGYAYTHHGYPSYSGLPPPRAMHPGWRHPGIGRHASALGAAPTLGGGAPQRQQRAAEFEPPHGLPPLSTAEGAYRATGCLSWGELDGMPSQAPASPMRSPWDGRGSQRDLDEAAYGYLHDDRTDRGRERRPSLTPRGAAVAATIAEVPVAAKAKKGGAKKAAAGAKKGGAKSAALDLLTK